jgi:2-amino-4-hydroxy-6-hydroxymethyldihydropteridine diphosphokinase
MNTLHNTVKSDNIFIALGANLGNLEDTFKRVKSLLSDKLTILQESSLYRTKPVGPVQPDYLNQVIRCSTNLSPNEVLEFLLDTEKKCGRVRTAEKDSPRVIDCDLLIYDKVVENSYNLILPHPRLAERSFVIVPLIEIMGVENDVISWALGVEKY